MFDLVKLRTTDLLSPEAVEEGGRVLDFGQPGGELIGKGEGLGLNGKRDPLKFFKEEVRYVQCENLWKIFFKIAMGSIQFPKKIYFYLLRLKS